MSGLAPLLIEALHDAEVESTMKTYEEMRRKVDFSREVKVVNENEKYVLFQSTIDEGHFHNEGALFFHSFGPSTNLPPNGIQDLYLSIGGVKVGGVVDMKRHRLVTNTRFDGEYGDVWIVGFNIVMIQLKIGPFPSRAHFDFFLQGNNDFANHRELQVSCRPFLVPDSRFNFWHNVLTTPETVSTPTHYPLQVKSQQKRPKQKCCPSTLICEAAATLRESVLVDLQAEICNLRNDLPRGREVTISAASPSWRKYNCTEELDKFTFGRHLIKNGISSGFGVYFDNPRTVFVPTLDFSFQTCIGGMMVSKFEVSQKTLLTECFYYDDGWFNMMAKFDDIQILFNIKPVTIEESSWDFETDEEIVEMSNGSINSHRVLEIFYDLIRETRVSHFELTIEESHFSISRFEGLLQQLDVDDAKKCHIDDSMDCCSKKGTRTSRESLLEQRRGNSAAQICLNEFFHSLSPARKIRHFASCATSKLLIAILGGLHADYYYM